MQQGSELFGQTCVIKILGDGAEQTKSLRGLIGNAAEREVCKEHTECDRDHKKRLILLDNTEVHQNKRYEQHDCLLPSEVGEAGVT